MKHALLFAVSLAALGLAGCKKSEPAADASAAATDINDIGTASTPSVSPAQAFANTAAASDAFEIESSRLAQTKSQSAKIKNFADQMIKAHTDSTAKLKDAAAKATPAITPVPQLTSEQQRMLDDLKAQSGDQFDTAYAQAQRDAHQTTLDALKSYADTGDVPALKMFASQMVPVVTAHLNMAKAL